MSRVCLVLPLGLPRGRLPFLAVLMCFVSASCGGKSTSTDNSGIGGLNGSAGTPGAEAAGSNANGDCSGVRITEDEATTLYTKYAFEVQPNLNPATTFDSVEQTVDGLWENLHAQLFNARAYSEDGTLWRECSVVYHACQLTLPTNDCSMSEGSLGSGLVMNGAFYYSWMFGSGIMRSELGKLIPQGTGLTRTVSPAYTYADYALQASGANILVLEAIPTDFNVWTTAEPIGTLKDFGDRLAVVDSNGQEIGTTIP